MFSHFRVVRTQRTNPKNAGSAIRLWQQYADPIKMTAVTDINRQLPVSGSHAEKVVRNITKLRKSNIVLFPEDVELPDFAWEVQKLLQDDVLFARHKKWLLGVVPGGIHYAPHVSQREQVLKTTYPLVNNVHAITQAWLDEHLPLDNLQIWTPPEMWQYGVRP